MNVGVRGTIHAERERGGGGGRMEGGGEGGGCKEGGREKETASAHSTYTHKLTDSLL